MHRGIAHVRDYPVVEYRYRTPGGEWTVTREPLVPLAASDAEAQIEIETSHDAGDRWSPPARVVLAWIGDTLQVAELERVTR